MTALERALVVYAEAKGYEIDTKKKTDGRPAWRIKEPDESFKFRSQFYRIKDLGTAYMVYCELANSFGGQYPKTITPNHERTWNIEDLKKVPRQGFSCKTKILAREEIEEMNKPKEEEFDVKAYVKSLVQTPEYLERCKEVNPIIEILEAYKNGETIERKEKYSSYEWSECETMELFNPMDFDYRISPKQPEAIPATEEELEIIGKGVSWCRNKKDPNRMGCIRHNDKLNKSDWFLFDEQTKTWQDWGSK